MLKLEQEGKRTMYITCLDLEGVLVPEIWVAFAEETGIPELKKTTRDEPDYDKLMQYRLDILKEHHLGLNEIQETISRINPMEGRKRIPRRAPLLHSGDHHQRHLQGVRRTADEETRLSDTLLQ
jgi:hypothetical protein